MPVEVPISVILKASPLQEHSFKVAHHFDIPTAPFNCKKAQKSVIKTRGVHNVNKRTVNNKLHFLYNRNKLQINTTVAKNRLDCQATNISINCQGWFKKNNHLSC